MFNQIACGSSCFKNNNNNTNNNNTNNNNNNNNNNDNTTTTNNTVYFLCAHSGTKQALGALHIGTEKHGDNP